MKPMLPPLKRSHSALQTLAWIAIALLVHGCATPPPQPAAEPVVRADDGRVLARDDEFAIVVARADDTAQSLAQQYLGDARKSWWITEGNGGAEVRSGQVVVIPLVQRNRIGVYADGFQTIPVLCYHRFGGRASKLTVTPAAFTAQMEYLARNGYHVLALKDLGAFIAGREPLPKKSVIITIDDGYRATYDIAYPILRKFGFPATVFLYSDFVGAGDALTYPQMKELIASGLVDIQPHSKTHSNLTLKLPDENDAKYRERLRREVDAPVDVIRDRLALASYAYAYPYGDVNELAVDYLSRRGVSLGLTVTPGGNGFFAYQYMLRRTMIFGNEDLEAFKAKLQTFVRTAGR
ncbi:MAG TPA: polysaccharide deacetylase family protein [Casimicrobiaceae bacterium]|nr:polysaccharide deacetylase family protein [Casimicrobiaceae bacterium]